MNIAAATEKYHTLNNQIEKMCQDFEDHFTPLVYKEIKNGNIEKALKIARECPDEVVRCFLFDAIRTYGEKRYGDKGFLPKYIPHSKRM